MGAYPQLAQTSLGLGLGGHRPPHYSQIGGSSQTVWFSVERLAVERWGGTLHPTYRGLEWPRSPERNDYPRTMQTGCLSEEPEPVGTSSTFHRIL